jgi:type 2 lantibiotic biosynthesis protein LanM
MDNPGFQSSVWFHAATLTERVATLPAAPSNTAGEVDTHRARRRLARWRAQTPFSELSSGVSLARRLAADGITEEQLLALLGEPIEAVQARHDGTPAWLADLARAFERPSRGADGERPAAGSAMESFLTAIEPLLGQARDRLREGIRELRRSRSSLPFDPEAVEPALLQILHGRLFLMIGRTFALELNVARLQGHLHGDTPEERFRSFVERLAGREAALALLLEYPVLARSLTLCVQNWEAFSLEFLSRLCADWEAIRAALCPQVDPGVLVAVDGAGDTHRGGRAVLIATFSSGLRLVYKPRSLAVDVHFQALLAWINEHGARHPFRTLTVLDRGAYGWVEYVDPEDCAATAEVRRFYERQGAFLALLYAMEATDIHLENLIAAGEHPVLVDLEAFLQPYVDGIDVRQADELAAGTFNYSVLRVGLLPQRAWSTPESDGIDLSGLGGVPDQVTPFPVPHWEEVGTDTMRLARAPMALPGGRNRPVLNGDAVGVLDHAEAIVTGFTEMYRLLLRHRRELLADGGPLARFASDEVRIVLRATRTYAMLLQEAFHPDVLRDALERERLLDRLWLRVVHTPRLATVIAAERDDLRQGDIPLFTTRSDCRDLFGSQGQRFPDFFDASGMEVVRRRVQQLGEADLARQTWFIRASLATIVPDADHSRVAAVRPPAPAAVPAGRERLVAAARAIGDRLDALALRGDDDVSWIGLTPLNGRHWSVVPVEMDLYNGLPGILLFLARLGETTGEARYTALAEAALTTLRRHVEKRGPELTSIGAFAGWGGVIYTLTHLAALWRRPALVAEAEALVERLPPLIERDTYLDLIGGAAGCIGGLASLYRHAPSAPVLRAARLCGDRLIACARPMEHGVGWMLPQVKGAALAGFSHGAAGMAWALLELAELTGDGRYRSTAIAALDYERSLFSSAHRNWPDLRSRDKTDHAADGGGPDFMLAWCHGAPGIALARLSSLGHLDDAAIRSEIDAALTTTLANGFGGNHSLCHGDLGNLEALLHAAVTLGDVQWQAAAQGVTAAILADIEQNGPRCSAPLEVETPGLMSGLAGIGYGLLRAAAPDRVPSVLALAPPHDARHGQTASWLVA